MKHPAAVEREAGQQVEPGEDDVGNPKQTEHSPPRAGHHEPEDRQSTPPSTSEASGPAAATANSSPGPWASSRISETPPKMNSLIWSNIEAAATGHHRVTQLVNEHTAQKEQARVVA